MSVVALAGLALLTASPLPLVAVTPFRSGATAAIAYTFDDGSQNQVDIAVPLLEEFGWRGTFFLVTGVIREHKSDPRLPHSTREGNGGASWEEWREIARRGHEIGNHSLTHANLTKMTDTAELDREINGSADLIAKQIGTPPLTFCYPGNGQTPAVHAQAMQRHLASRDYCTGFGGKDFTLAQANAAVDRALRERRDAVIMIHGIAEGYAPLDPALFRQHLEYVRGLGTQVWVDTFANLNRYRLERQAATLQVVSTGAHEVRFTLNAPLDPAIFNLPLTVAVTASAPVARAKAGYVGEDPTLPARAVGSQILVEVPPSAREVRVQWR